MKKPAWIAAAVALPFLGILILHARHYSPFISDDALISLRYARRLLDGQGLTWSEGRPVEGYSNLLWILSVAFLGLFGMDLIAAARFLGVLGMSAILFFLSYWYIREGGFRNAWFPLAISLLFVSLGAPIAVWAIGGLEQPLYGALIAVSIPLMFGIVESGKAGRKEVLCLSLVLGLLCLTRPDGPIFAAAAAASIFFAGRLRKNRRLLIDSFLVLLFPILFYLGQLGFRAYYYGELLPIPALIKIAPSYRHFVTGLGYLLKGLISLFPFSFLAIFSISAMLFSPARRMRGFYLFATSLLWSFYLIFIGGDIFPAYRHFIPLMAVFAFALAEGFSMAMHPPAGTPPGARIRTFIIAFGFISVLPYAYLQFSHGQNRRAVEERWEWAGRDLGLLLGKAFGTQQPLLAVTAAGCLPYWSDLPSLDMLGLNDYYIPRHRPADIGGGFIGHEFGDGKYVLSREPDLVVFHVGSEPNFKSGLEMQADPQFHRLYIPITVQTAPGKSAAIVYVNKYSRKIGLLKSESRISIPGYLLTGPDAMAYLNPADKLVLRLQGKRPAGITFDSDPSRNWSVSVETTPPDAVSGEIRQTDSSLAILLSAQGVEPVEVDSVILKGVAIESKDLSR